MSTLIQDALAKYDYKKVADLALEWLMRDSGNDVAYQYYNFATIKMLENALNE